jgi:hypothetical protein
MDVFDRRGNKTCDYVLLRSEQVQLSIDPFLVKIECLPSWWELR